MTTLRTTNAQFHQLHKIINERRSNTIEVRVPVDALRNLLLDHSTLVQEHKPNEPEEDNA